MVAFPNDRVNTTQRLQHRWMEPLLVRAGFTTQSSRQANPLAFEAPQHVSSPARWSTVSNADRRYLQDCIILIYKWLDLYRSSTAHQFKSTWVFCKQGYCRVDFPHPCFVQRFISLRNNILRLLQQQQAEIISYCLL